MIPLVPCARSADLISLTLTFTNALGTTNGDALTIDGITKTFTNDVTSSPSTLIATNSRNQSATNLHQNVAVHGWNALQPSYASTNQVKLIALPGVTISYSIDGTWGTGTLTTNTTGGGTVVKVPLTGESLEIRTNIISDLVGHMLRSTNALEAGSTVVSNLLQTSGDQSASGAKTFTGSINGTLGNATNGTLHNPTISNSPAISGYAVAVSNGTFRSPIIVNPYTTNLTNYGNAISSPGLGVDSEQFGTGASATNAASMAIGLNASAWGDTSLAVGYSSRSAGTNSTAIGETASADAYGSTALGAYARVTLDGPYGVAIGGASIVEYSNAVAIGTAAEATAPDQIMLGNSEHTVVIPGVLEANSATNTHLRGTNQIESLGFTRSIVTAVANGNNTVPIPDGVVYVSLTGSPTAAWTNCAMSGTAWDGRFLIVENATGYGMAIANESGFDGTVSRRIVTSSGGELYLSGRRTCLFVYSGASSRWVLIYPTTFDDDSTNNSYLALSDTNTYSAGLLTTATNSFLKLADTNAYGAGLLTTATNAFIDADQGWGTNNQIINPIFWGDVWVETNIYFYEPGLYPAMLWDDATKDWTLTNGYFGSSLVFSNNLAINTNLIVNGILYGCGSGLSNLPANMLTGVWATATINGGSATNLKLFTPTLSSPTSSNVTIYPAAYNANPLSVLDNLNRNALTVASNGFTGIRTNNPQTSLHVANLAANGDTAIDMANDVQTWRMRVYGTGYDQFQVYDVVNNKTPFGIAPNQSDNMLYITNNRVGIGTANPAYSLGVAGNIGTSGYVEASSLAASASAPYLQLSDLTSSEDDYLLYVNTNYIKILNVTDVRTDLAIDGNGAATFGGALTVTSNLLIGTGTASATSRLQISPTNGSDLAVISLYQTNGGRAFWVEGTNGAATFGGALNVVGNQTNAGWLDITGNITNRGSVAIANAAPTLSLEDTTPGTSYRLRVDTNFFQIEAIGGATVLQIDSSGQMGVGGYNPVEGWSINGGSIYLAGTLSADTVTDRSAAPKTIADAYAVVASVQSTPDGKVDHAKLNVLAKTKSGGRDLGMVISAQAIVIQDLLKRIEVLEKK